MGEQVLEPAPGTDEFHLLQLMEDLELEEAPRNPRELWVLATQFANDHHWQLTEAQRDAVTWAIERYQRWRRHQTPPAPPPQPLPPRPKPPPPPVSGPQPTAPPYEETPATLGAAEEPTPTVVFVPPRQVPRDASEYDGGQIWWFGAGEYDSPELIAEQVTDLDPADGDRQDIADRIRRNQPEPGRPDPTFWRPTARNPASDGDPVDLFTGAFTLSEVDLAVPTPFLPIRFERRYRSGRPYFGPFGYGWDHNHNVYLRPLKDGGLALWTGQLREHRFEPEAGGWAAERGLAARLETVPGVAGSYLVRFPGGLSWRFQRPAGWGSGDRIPLASVEDRHGNQVRLAYDDRDRVASVRDGAGRGLLFGYGDCGLLEEVSDHTGGRRVRYEHHGEIEHLVRVVLPATAQFPDGVPTSYEYDWTAPHPAARHNLLRIQDSLGRTYLENEYAGWEAGWAFNTVSRQRAGDFEYEFGYEQLQYVWPDPVHADVAATRTSVRHPDGSLQLYTFNYRGDLLDHRFRLNADRSYRVVSRQWSYDAHGNLVEAVAADGGRTVWSYDENNPDPLARAQPLRVEQLAPPGSPLPGRVLSRVEYEPRYQLPTSLTDETGQRTRLFYDFDSGHPGATGRLARVERPTVTLADGTAQHGISWYEQNSVGQVTVAVSATGVRDEFRYHVGGLHHGLLRERVSDVLGVAATALTGYDPAGFPSSTTGPGGAVTEYTTNALGQQEEIRLPEVDGARAVLRYWLGETGNPLRVRRPRGACADPALGDPFLLDRAEEDQLGRVVAVTSAVNTSRPRQVRSRLDHAGRPVSSWDPTGVRTDYRYDERGLLLRRTEGVGTESAATTSYRYDLAGRLVRTTDPVGRVTAVHRDPWGRPIRIDHPSGAHETLSWAPGDRLVERAVTGSPGPGLPVRQLSRESLGYDEIGRLSTHTVWSFQDDPTAATPLTTQVSYDADDRQRLVRSPRGGTVGYRYDGLNRLAETVDALGNRVLYRYAPAGHLSEVRVEETGGLAARTHRYSCDARGRLRRSEGPDGAVVEIDYDDRDVVVERREPAGVRMRFAVGPHGELDQAALDPAGLNIVAAYGYDANGQCVRYTDPTGQTTSWRRDPLGRTIRETLPDATSWTQRFDPLGRVAEQHTPAGARISYHYDEGAAGPVRVLVSAAPGAPPVVREFGYDSLDRLVSARNAVTTVERRYDSLSRVTAETAFGETVLTLRDDLLGTFDLVYPDGRRERTEHDIAGRPVRATLVAPGTLPGTPGLLLGVEYAGLDRPVRLRHGNGVRAELGYDEAARLVRLDLDRAGSALESVRTLHDERGRRALTQYTAAPRVNRWHRFDRRDRLTEARWGFALPDQAPGNAAQQAAAAAAAGSAAAAAPSFHGYQLDAADNRLVRTGHDGVDSYGYGPGHQLTGVDGTPFGHHADGARERDGRYRYETDVFGQVTAVRELVTGAPVAEFRYDALSRVAAGTVDGDGFRRWYALGGCVQQTGGNGAAGAVRQFSPHPLWPVPCAVLDAAGQRYVHSDGALSSVCTTDESGAVAERHRFGPFGESQLYRGDGVTPLAAPSHGLWWRGMPQLASVGHYETPNRLYDPAVGGFLARDPLGYADSPSPYVFAAHNPVDFADPSGLEKTPADPKFTDWLDIQRAQPRPRDWLQAERDWRRRTDFGMPVASLGPNGEVTIPQRAAETVIVGTPPQPPSAPDGSHGYYLMGRVVDQLLTQGDQAFASGRYLEGVVGWGLAAIMEGPAAVEGVLPYNAPDKFLVAGRYAQRWVWYDRRGRSVEGLLELGKGQLEANDFSAAGISPLLYFRPSHVYEIRWRRIGTTETGRFKTGMSSGRVTQDQRSYRANRQISVLNLFYKLAGYEFYHGDLHVEHGGQQLNRAQAFWLESYLVTEFEKQQGHVAPGNQLPLPWQGPYPPKPK